MNLKHSDSFGTSPLTPKQKQLLQWALEWAAAEFYSADGRLDLPKDCSLTEFETWTEVEETISLLFSEIQP